MTTPTPFNRDSLICIDNYRGHKLRGGGATVGVTMGTKTDNPFGPRPSSASLARKQSVASVTLNTQDKPEMVMGELDDSENMPEGLEHYQWDRFVVARHRKVESELRVSITNTHTCIHDSMYIILYMYMYM